MKSVYRFNWCIVFAMIFVHGLIIAQPINTNTSSYVLPPPEVSSLGYFIETPVNTFTGSAAINIPIASISEGPLRVEVGLNYNTSGIRVEEVSSWVGMNWALQTGGTLSRIVRGLPDEARGVQQGYSVTGTMINNASSLYAFQDQITAGNFDTEADIFNFQAGIYSGKFYIDRNGTAIFTDGQSITVETNDSNLRNWNQIIITTPDGNRYYYGMYGNKSAHEIQSTTIDGANTDPNDIPQYPTVWHLLRIEDYTQKHVISYSYTDEAYEYKQRGRCYYEQEVWQTGTCGTYGDSRIVCATGDRNTSFIQHISGQRLTKISTTNQSIEFIATTNRIDVSHNAFEIGVEQAKQLDKIRVRNGVFSKEFIFSMDYYSDPSGTDPHFYRLRLNSIQEWKSNALKIPPYGFTYEGDFLPHRLNAGLDHYGFYNNKENTNDSKDVLSPPTPIFFPTGEFTYGEANRDVDTNYHDLGLLKEVVNPMGGITILESEPHQFSGLATVRDNACTLRICGPDIDPLIQNVACNNQINTTSKTHSTEDINGGRLHLELCALTPGTSQGNGSPYVISGLLDISRTVDNSSIYSHIISIEVEQGETGNTADNIFLRHIDGLLANVNYTYSLTLSSTGVNNGFVSMEFYKPEQQDITAGGARIKSITYKDGIGQNPDVIREYRYTMEDNAEISSGILSNVPNYGYFTMQPLQGSSGSVTHLRWASSSYVPLGGYHGSYIAYEYVEEEQADLGIKRVRHYIEEPHMDANWPQSPLRGNERHGAIRSQSNYNDLGDIIQYDSCTINTVALKLDEMHTYGLLNVVLDVAPLMCASELNLLVFQPYQPIVPIYRKTYQYDLKDGVSVEEWTTYDPLVRHLYPLNHKTINSDGTAFITENTYAFDYSNVFTGDTSIQNNLLKKNLILPAFQSTVSSEVANQITQVKGVRTAWGFYDSLGDSISGLSEYLFPRRLFHYEMTWNDVGVPQSDGWVNQIHMDKYNILESQPERIYVDGWLDPYNFEYTDSGRREAIKFRDFVTQTQFYPNSDLVHRIIQPNSTSISYSYDDLLRLKTSTNCQGVVNTYNYHYTTGGSDKNYVQTFSNYPSFGEEEAPLILSYKQIMDGLGRNIQSINLKQAPGNPNQHLSTWTTYDNVGRPTRQYDPQVVTSANYTDPSTLSGVEWYVETLYEASPLNRPISVGHSEWHPTETIYASNAAGEVMDLSAGGGYAANTLTKVIQKVPTHTVGSTQHYTEQISYRDRRGREVLMRTRDTESGETTDTYTTYDDKDRLYQVIPPDATLSDAGLIYTNLYYGNDLMWRKKVPDRDWEEFRYNHRDLLAYRQDGYLKNKSQWMGMQYDPYGRLTHQGFYNNAPAVNNSFTQASIDEELIANTYGTSGIEIDKLVNSNAQLLGKSGSITRNYGYDACGRQNHVWGNTIKSLSNLTAYDMTTVYDDADNILSTTELLHESTSAVGGLTILNSYHYDHAGRKSADFIKINDLTEQQICEETYTGKEQIESLTLGNNLQVINYAYKGNGFLESINNPSQLGGDLWAMDLGYDAGTSAQTPNSELRKDGNITSVHWKTAGQSKQGYNYTYDYRSWLTNADYFESGKNGRYSTSYIYKDKRGNFDKIMRMGMMDGTAGQIDNLNFGYYPLTNRIRTITDGGTAAVKSGGYKSNVGDYTYNDNGAMDHDPSRGANFTLNFMDLPDEISVPDSSGSIQYLYDASGVYHGQLEIRDGKQVASRYHIGSVEYDDGIVDQIMTSQGYVELEYAVPTHVFRTGVEPNTTQQGISVKSEASVINNRNVIYEGGQYVCLDEAFTVDVGGDFEAWIKDFPPTSFSHRYIIKDHLGSARIIFSDLDKNGSVDASEIINHFEYYPFGSFWEGDWNDNSKYNHLFTGQERQKRFGLGYDRFGARFYDPAIARFTGVDPISDQFPHLSTYNYAGNSPITNIDLWGLQPLSYLYRKEFGRVAQTINQKTGVNIPLTSNSPTPPRVNVSMADIGNGMQDLGGAIELTGLTVAIVAPPAGGTIAAAGTAIDIAGTAIVTLAEVNEEGDVSTETKIEIGFDIAGAILPKPLEKTIDNEVPEILAEYFKANINLVTTATRAAVEEKIKEHNSTQEKCEDSCNQP